MTTFTTIHISVKLQSKIETVNIKEPSRRRRCHVGRYQVVVNCITNYYEKRNNVQTDSHAPHFPSARGTCYIQRRQKPPVRFRSLYLKWVVHWRNGPHFPFLSNHLYHRRHGSIIDLLLPPGVYPPCYRSVYLLPVP